MVEISLPTDPGDLALDGDPPARALEALVVEVENHVPAAVELRLVESERGEEG